MRIVQTNSGFHVNAKLLNFTEEQKSASGRYSNLVSRVLRLFGQRVGGRRDAGEFEKI